MAATEHRYGFEIVEEDPRADQPELVRTVLKPHQLAALEKARSMERDGAIRYSVPNPENYMMARTSTRIGVMLRGNFVVRTNIGIMGDIVGYGKTLTALALVASAPTSHIHRIGHHTYSYYSSRSKSYIQVDRQIPEDADERKLFATTLVIVPRGPVYTQWEECIRNSTGLRCLTIDDVRAIKKRCPPIGSTNEQLMAFFDNYDIVLAKNTSIQKLIDYYNVPFKTSPIRGFDRIMIDEAHDILSKSVALEHKFLWMITASYKRIQVWGAGSSSMAGLLKEMMGEERMNTILVKCEEDFTRMSFDVPAYREIVYRCTMPRVVSIVQPFLSKNVLDLVNANDIEGAIRELGGRTETEDNILNVLTRNINREIHNKEREREYVQTLDLSEEARDTKLRSIANDLERLNKQIRNLEERVEEMASDACSICYDAIEAPVLLPCSHMFCGVCIMKWIEINDRSSKSCPKCRTTIASKENLTAIVKKTNDAAASSSKKEDKEEKEVSKLDTILRIIRERPNGKFLIFSQHDFAFHQVIMELHRIGVSTSELKGNTHQMAKILERFRNGDLRVILLNTFYAGSGIDISCATDVIMFHSMGSHREQAIGRAQRVGRKEQLTVHRLCYPHEIDGQ